MTAIETLAPFMNQKSKRTLRLCFLLPLLISLLPSCGKQESASDASKSETIKGGAQVTVAMMPKSKGNAYFISCKKGAEKRRRNWAAN